MEQKTGAITSVKLLTHLHKSRICFDYYNCVGDGVNGFSSFLYKVTWDKQDVSKPFGLVTITQNGPASGMPKNLDNQEVLYNLLLMKLIVA